MRDRAKASSTATGGRFGAEELCIKFVNTVAWRKAAHSEERLDSAEMLFRWFLGVGFLRRGSQFAKLWRTDSRLAQETHVAALRLREAIYQLFVARIDSEKPPARALVALNTFLGAGRSMLAYRKKILRWDADGLGITPTTLLTPIAWSAAILLAGPRIKRVKQCHDEQGCGWLFLDTSRTGTRLWCSMGDCGNRAKARRHYARSKRVA
jgi:predicted RNA-binding Zn ribbon-like protein